MKKAGVFIAFLAVASSVALAVASLDPCASSSSSKVVQLSLSLPPGLGSSREGDVRLGSRKGVEDKFAPRFDGLRFIEMLVTVSSSCRPLVRKKAALCLLRLYRKNPDVVNIDGWSDRMSQLLDERDLGVLTSVMSLFVAIVSNNVEAYWNCLPKCVKILERLGRNQDVPQEYTYHGIPSPWIQVKTMRALQYFPTIEDPNTRRALFEVLQRILMGTDVVKNVNKNNAVHAILFEALALENMTRMLLVSDVQDIIKSHQAQIIISLKDPDISIRRRALDLLYGMCDVTNAKDIVEELLQYLNTADFAMREELALKAAILAEKFAPDLSWYVDVILQLIDKAGDFVSDDIWYRVVQFVTNNEDLQPYAAAKAREYLEKPALHETMVKVSAYLLGEYSHLLARRTGCTLKEIFIIINEKLPTVTTSTVAILLSTYAKILMHNHPPDPELQEQIWSIFRKYESCIDVEIQQRAVEYIALCNKGAALVDVLAEMPKFPERQSALLKKAEVAEVDTAEQSAIRIRSQQQTSNALVVTDQRPTEGSLPVSQLGLVRMPSEASTQDQTSFQDEGMTKENGVITEVVPQDVPPADLLGDLLGSLAINGSPATAVPVEQRNQNLLSVVEATPEAAGPFTLTIVDNQPNSIQPIVNIAERFNELCLKDSGVLYEDPHIQVQCPLEFVNLRASRDVAVLDFSYKFGTAMVNVKLRLPAVINKFLQPISVTAEEFFDQWKSLSGPPLKLQEVLRGVKPLSLPEIANLFTSLHLAVNPGIDTNPNNLIACTTFYSESTRATLCLIRVETDPSDRTQLRITIASGDPTLTLKERIKEYLVNIPTQTPSAVVAPLQPQSPVTPVAYNDPGAMLAGLL
ncbi:hypothetical protein C4D60_Mb05t14730 [Musa balbisiana]|uniref:AP-2 complex subunit alpha n=1 Tax=Musa balbisiana TaxID=52838 RepID=A0A4S8JW63_MUSBA|nr:hypothetical protein C4D60_Mb05t14730 [Musa balbisiana]